DSHCAAEGALSSSWLLFWGDDRLRNGQASEDSRSGGGVVSDVQYARTGFFKMVAAQAELPREAHRARIEKTSHAQNPRKAYRFSYQSGRASPARLRKFQSCSVACPREILYRLR